MGTISTVLVGKNDKYGYSCVTTPLMYRRRLDYTIAGSPKPCIEVTWELALRSMVTTDLMTRKLLYPVIENRMKAIKAESTYENDWLAMLKHPRLSEAQVLEYHDIFEMFTYGDDGKIPIIDLIMELENYNDRTPLKTRIDMICQYVDGYGHLSFQKFLDLMIFLNKPGSANIPLRETFEKLGKINHYLRQMAITQQVQTGFL